MYIDQIVKIVLDVMLFNDFINLLKSLIIVKFCKLTLKKILIYE